MIRGKFQAQDDVDVAGHRLLNWNWISDIPVGDSTPGQAIVNVDGVADWATIASSCITNVEWDDVSGKPSVFPPEDHTHSWTEVTDKPSVFPPDTHTHVVADIVDFPVYSRVVMLDKNVVSSTVLIPTGLSFNLTANKKYSMRAVLLGKGRVGAFNPDLKYAISVSSGMSIHWYPTPSRTGSIAYRNGDVAVILLDATDDKMVAIDGVVQCGASDGTMAVYFAQNSTSSTTTTLLAGSNVQLFEVT